MENGAGVNNALDTVKRIYAEACDSGFDPSYDVIKEIEALKKHPQAISIELGIELEELIKFLEQRADHERCEQLEAAFLLLCPEAEFI